MRKYIQKYLNEKYYVTTSPIGNFGIYALADKDSLYLYTEYGDNIIKEIITIFSIEKEEAKLEIHIWATGNSQTSEVNLDFYWEYNATPMNIGDLLSPILNRIELRTIANDLLAVQAMSMPQGLIELNPQYDLKKSWYSIIWDKIYNKK